MHKENVFIATSSFGTISKTPLKLLKKHKISFKLNPYKRKLNKNEIIENAKNFKYIIAGTEKYDKEVLGKLINLKAIFRLGSGIDNLDLKFLKKKKIKLFKSTITPEKSVAELNVAMILSHLKELNFHNNNMKNKVWKKRFNSLLFKKTIGIVGYGKVGKYTEKILKNFGVNILINEAKKIHKSKTSLIKLIRLSDIIIFCASIHKNMKPLINSSNIKYLKKNCLIVNTARPELLDYELLYNAVSKKKLSGLALDVYPTEPYYGILSKLKNITLTPHIAGYSKEIRSEMEFEIINKILKFSGG